MLASLPLRPGDEVLVLSHVYGAVRNAVRHVAGRAGARVVEAALPFPGTTGRAFLPPSTPRCRHAPGWRCWTTSPRRARWAAGCPHGRGVPAAGVAVLVDGAHGPGQVALDMRGIGADWYVGNCHKWLMAPKGAGFLWAAPQRQAGLHPVTISHGYGQGFVAEFDWTGTRDPSACLAVPDAIAFHHGSAGRG